MRGHNRNALWLAGDGQEPLITSGIVAAHGGKVLVLIADKDGRTKVLARLGIHLGDTQLHRTLVVDLHHGADGLRQRRVQHHRKIQTNNLPGFDQFLEGRQDTSMWVIRTELAFIEFLRRTEDATDLGIGLEQREKYRDALDDRGFDRLYLR